jgi:hypothetical protein
MDHEVLVSPRSRKKQVIRTGVAIVVLLFAVVVVASQGGRDEVRLELNSTGFAPAEFQHGPGTFAIAVENKTLAEEYTLRLKAEDGTLLNEFQIQKGSSAWTVNLPTGRYELTEANHPQWTCRIVVQ